MSLTKVLTGHLKRIHLSDKHAVNIPIRSASTPASDGLPERCILFLALGSNIEKTIKTSVFSKVDKAIELVGAETLQDTMNCLRRWGEVGFVSLLGGGLVIDNFHLMNDCQTPLSFRFLAVAY